MHEEYRIEKGVPMPDEDARRAVRKTKYPWQKMDVGDSFTYRGKRKVIETLAARAGKTHKKRFLVRNVGEGVCRVWRTE